MTRLLWSPRASSDLDLIREYISRDSPVYADLVIQRLVLAPERLIQFPEIGRVVPEVMSSPNLREIIVRPYRVVYRIRPGLVEIVTVFRSSRQFPADLE